VDIAELGVATCQAGVYPTAGTHVITARYSVGDGSVDSAPLSEVISDARLYGTAMASLSGIESEPVASGQLAIFVDANHNGVASDFTANVDWGDGSASAEVVATGPVGSFRVPGSHTYADAGAYRVTVTITDSKGGATLTIGLNAVIADIPLVVSGVSTSHASAGQPFTAVVATFVDPAGKELDFLAVDGDGVTTNCCFGGADGRTLFATDAVPGRVVVWEGLPQPGLPMHTWPGPR